MSRQANVLFDSARAGPFVGLRAVACPGRSLLFSGAGLSVDLVFLPATDHLHMAHGQVIDAAGEQPVAGARITLGPDGEAVTSDAFGQFTVSTLGDPAGQALWVQAGDVALACTVPGRQEALR